MTSWSLLNICRLTVWHKLIMILFSPPQIVGILHSTSVLVSCTVDSFFSSFVASVESELEEQAPKTNTVRMAVNHNL